MKRFLPILLIFVLLISLYGCKQTSINNQATVTLTFVYGADSIITTLDQNESQIITSILNEKKYSFNLFGGPSCGFSENVSLKIDGNCYAIACDDCNKIKDINASKYFNVSEADMEYIHSVFEKYGGYFPCV